MGLSIPSAATGIAGNPSSLFYRPAVSDWLTRLGVTPAETATEREVLEEVFEAAIRKVIDLSPSGIRRHLNLNTPIYARTSAYGHFGRKAGRDGSFSWWHFHSNRR